MFIVSDIDGHQRAWVDTAWADTLSAIIYRSRAQPRTFRRVGALSYLLSSPSDGPTMRNALERMIQSEANVLSHNGPSQAANSRAT